MTAKRVASQQRRKRRKKKTLEQLQRAQERRVLRESDAPGRGVTLEDRKLVYTLYGRACLCCGKSHRRMDLDHVVPLCKGGRHDADNLQTLCRRCHNKKGLSSTDYRPFPFPDEWREFTETKPQ